MDIVPDIMTKTVVTCSPNTDILEVKYLMSKHKLTRIVVVDSESKPIGIVTRKDLMNYLFVHKPKKELDKISVDEIMSKNLITIGPSTLVSDAAKIMIKKKISSLLVVINNNQLIGIITKSDLTMYFATTGTDLYFVRDFMTPNPLTVKPSHSILYASSLMTENAVSRLIVVDEKSSPIGILTLTDAVPLIAILPKLSHLTVHDGMNREPILINKNADLSEAAKLMTRHKISGLPVIDNFGKLVGIITKSDIIRALSTKK